MRIICLIILISICKINSMDQPVKTNQDMKRLTEDQQRAIAAIFFTKNGSEPTESHEAYLKRQVDSVLNGGTHVELEKLKELYAKPLQLKIEQLERQNEETKKNFDWIQNKLKIVVDQIKKAEEKHQNNNRDLINSKSSFKPFAIGLFIGCATTGIVFWKLKSN